LFILDKIKDRVPFANSARHKKDIKTKPLYRATAKPYFGEAVDSSIE
jgi:hypothetical protein